MGHFDRLRTGFDRLSPNGVETSPYRINSGLNAPMTEPLHLDILGWCFFTERAVRTSKPMDCHVGSASAAPLAANATGWRGKGGCPSSIDDKTPDVFYFDNLPAMQKAA